MPHPSSATISTLVLDHTEFRYGIRLRKITQDDLGQKWQAYKADFYRMLWVTRGSVNVDIDMADAELKRDECLFIGKNQVVRGRDNCSFEAYIVDFTEAFYSRTAQDTDFLQNCGVFSHPRGVLTLRLEETYKNILAEFLGFFDKISRKDFDPLLYQIAHNTIERMLLYAEWNLQQNLKVEFNFSNRKEYELVKNFRSLVNLHYASRKDVGFYAHELSVPPKRLNKACQQTHQPSPKKLILERILLEAKRNLRYTDLSVKEISWMLGYDQINSFIKLFTTYEGNTPQEYRKKSSQILV